MRRSCGWFGNQWLPPSGPTAVSPCKGVVWVGAEAGRDEHDEQSEPSEEQQRGADGVEVDPLTDVLAIRTRLRRG